MKEIEDLRSRINLSRFLELVLVLDLLSILWKGLKIKDQELIYLGSSSPWSMKKIENK